MRALRFLSLVSTLVLAPLAVQAGPLSSADTRVLCRAAVQEGALEVAVEHLMSAGRFGYQDAGALLVADCGGSTLLQQMINHAQAENLEFAVIDLGVDVNMPLVPVEAGELTVVQYLMQQAVLAPNEVAREFAMEYMQDLRSVDFNPNLQLVTLK
ncbi:MAG: hypothetical protein ACK4SX_05475 [Alcanivoracaceae bacterium]